MWARVAMLFLGACGRVAFDAVPEPVFEFRFEDSLEDAIDTRIASCTSCPTFAPGHRGEGARFDGGQCLTLDDEPVFHAAELTIAAWINVEAAVGDTVFAKSFDDNATGNNSWELWFPDETLAQFTTVEQGDNVYLGSDQVTLGVWRHYAGTLDASGKRFYVDGVERASAVPGRGTSYDAGKIRIGCDKDVGSEVGTFEGIIDDVVFYDRALSADEIALIAR